VRANAGDGFALAVARVFDNYPDARGPRSYAAIAHPTGVDVSFYQGQSPDGEVFAKDSTLAYGTASPKAELMPRSVLSQVGSTAWQESHLSVALPGERNSTRLIERRTL
jgi:hypothetical protein